MKTKHRVSIVIPVYNEQDHLAACLEAIARQTVQPLEVLVVDNNSTDATLDIAQSFGFVTVIHEARQGVIYARGRGFDAARGAIIGRIDADTIIAEDWVEQIQEIFMDSSLAAITGSLHYYDTPWSKLVDWVDLTCRKWLTPQLGDYMYLLGANMAIQREAWQTVRSQMCLQPSLHEDQDLAIHLARSGYKVDFTPGLNAAVSGRRVDSSFTDFCHYAYANIYTYGYHKLRERRAMYPIVAFVILCYVPMRIMYRGYDTERRIFKWYRVFMPRQIVRVNPVTFMSLAD